MPGLIKQLPLTDGQYSHVFLFGRLVPHDEQDELLAAACPLPNMVAGVGHVFHHGEYWLLIYEPCGHDQYFRRTADGL